MSGAGRTTCLKILEDLGYEAVDNLPVNLLGRVLRGDDAGPDRLAMGVDSRTRGFAPRGCGHAGRRPGQRGGRAAYLDCDDEVLRRRFTETRRRHPLADLPGVRDALLALMEGLVLTVGDLIWHPAQGRPRTFEEIRRLEPQHGVAPGLSLRVGGQADHAAVVGEECHRVVEPMLALWQRVHGGPRFRGRRLQQADLLAGILDLVRESRRPARARCHPAAARSSDIHLGGPRAMVLPYISVSRSCQDQ